MNEYEFHDFRDMFIDRLRGKLTRDAGANIQYHVKNFSLHWIKAYEPPGNHGDTHRLLANALKDDVAGL